MNWMKWGDPKPQDGQEVIVRVKAHNGSWIYQIGICLDGFFRNPYMGCAMCGGDVHFLPRAWNPFGGTIAAEWMPLSKMVDSERTARHAIAERDQYYSRALKAEGLIYDWVMRIDDKAEDAMVAYVEEGLSKI